MRLILLFTLFGIFCCQAQVNLKMNVNSSFRETKVIRSINSSDTIIDNSLRFELVFSNSGKQKVLASKEITAYSSNHKETSDSILISKSDKKKLKLVHTININTFHKLFDLVKKESVSNYEKQKVLTTPYEISIELINGNDTINIKRKEQPADYVNHWYSNGKEIFNPKIDQIIAKILPKMVLGNFKLVKIPSKKRTKYHKDELTEILNRFIKYLQSKDSIKLKALAYELCPTINTVRYFEKNKLYYRRIPEVFHKKTEREIKLALKQNREAYASSFLNLLDNIKVDSAIELLTNNNEIKIEYSGFLSDFRFNSKIFAPRGNGAIETTHFYFKLKINNETNRYSFGEMLRVNNQWQSFTAPRL